uniref:Nucleolar complex protein 3 homolog n=1 Tax=Salmo trutta TaxID=8032 RepID=A0A673ZVY2_SALTR
WGPAKPRSKKRKPSFRRLLKTSNVKLDNKLKNRQFKKESTDKKHLIIIIFCLCETCLVSLNTCLVSVPEDEEEEEEFVESLPIDMMDDDLEQIRAMAQKASFLTRDLSSRKMQLTEEVIHLLPIKDKIRGLVPQSMEKPVEPKKAEEEADAPTGLERVSTEDEAVTGPALTPQEQLKLRTPKLMDRKLRIASLGSDILSEPTINIMKLQELRSMLMETDPYMAVTVRKLVMVSLMEVFKDIVPSNRIRPLTETEKASKVKKETQQLREFEEGLVSQYKFYLENNWKQKKRKGSEAVSLQSYKGLAEVAIRCICELLVALPHFNFHNIIVMVMSLMNDPIKRVSDMCCEAVKKLMKQDKQGQTSLGTVKVISGLVKSKNYDVRPELLKVLLYLRIKEVEVEKDTDDTAPKKKFMNYKDKKKNLSRMQRKVSSPSTCLPSLLKPMSVLILWLFFFPPGASNDDISIVLRCLDVMLTKRTKRVSLQRTLAFIKRLSTLSLHTLPNATVGILASNRMLIHVPSPSVTSSWTMRLRIVGCSFLSWTSRSTATPRTLPCGSYAHSG